MLEGKLDSNLVLYMEDFLNICERERERVNCVCVKTAYEVGYANFQYRQGS